MNEEIVMKKEAVLEMERDSDFMEDISGDDDYYDGDWTPDKLSKEEKRLAGMENIPMFFI